MIKNWTKWRRMSAPEDWKDNIIAPETCGVYQIRNRKTSQFIQFGESKTCRKRMKSFFPKPYGIGTRNNSAKREYVLANWKDLDYRTRQTDTKAEAKSIDTLLKSKNNHLFNT